MPKFKGTDFEIELPENFTDESTYAFAFPSRLNFRPSIVVKTERLAETTTLPDYVQRQLEKIKKLLPDVTIIADAPAKHGGLSAHTTVYDWGETPRRVRQKQRFLLLSDPARVVSLTGTSLRETFAEADALFEAIFASFDPVAVAARRGM